MLLCSVWDLCTSPAACVILRIVSQDAGESFFHFLISSRASGASVECDSDALQGRFSGSLDDGANLMQKSLMPAVSLLNLLWSDVHGADTR